MTREETPQAGKAFLQTVGGFEPRLVGRDRELASLERVSNGLNVPLLKSLYGPRRTLEQRVGGNRHAGTDRTAQVFPLRGNRIQRRRRPEVNDDQRPAEPLARAVYQDGWRPAYAPGPTRDRSAFCGKRGR